MFIIAGLASLGLPGTSGFVSELLVFVGTFPIWQWYTVIAAFGIVITAGYILWMIELTLFREPRERFSDIKDSLDNKGWIHVDDNQTFAGVVYLTPNINPNSGTSIFRLKDEYSDFNIHDLDVTPKIERYRNDIFEKNKLLKLETDIKKTLDYMYKRFELVTEVKNIYNRCVIFDSNQYHTANEYYTDGEERLTFVYFFKNVKSTVLPLEKIYEHDEDIKNRIKSYEDSIS